MKYLFITIMFLGLSSFAYYEDHKVVKALAKAGKPIISHNDVECPTRYIDDDSFVDRLGTSYDPFCVKHVSLPAKVLKEVLDMEENELENLSDYDQRVTKYYVFKQCKYNPKRYVGERGIKELAKAFNIPQDQVKGLQFSAFIADSNSFSELGGLFVRSATEGYREITRTLRHTRSLLKGQLVLRASFGDGIDLYPGGGFAVTYYIYITKTHLVYVKKSGWDS